MRSFLFWLLLAWITGVMGGVAGEGRWWLAVIGVLVAGAAVRQNRPPQFTVAILVLTGLGFTHGWSAGRPQAVEECRLADNAAGVVESQPEYREQQVRFVARVEKCLVLVMASPWLEVGQRDQVTISGGRRQSLDEVKKFSVPYADYLGRQSIGATWSFPQVEVRPMNKIRVWPGSDYTQLLSDHWRRRTQRLFIEPDASLVMGMLLAQKGTIPEGITRQFRATGVSHILAISGLHVSIIAGLIYAVLSVLPWRPWYRTAAILAALWWYVMFVGAPVSAVRAGSFISVALVFIRLKKLASLPTALVLTVVAMITVQPSVMLEVGWQLSVGAVTGIFLVLFLSRAIEPKWTRRGLVRWIYQLWLVSLGATIMTWPLAAYHFGTVSLIGLAANLLVVPAVPFMIGFGVAAIILSYGWMTGALGLTWAVHWLVRWIEMVTGRLAAVPGAFIEEVSMPWWGVMLYYAVVMAAAGLIMRWQKRSWAEVWG